MLSENLKNILQSVEWSVLARYPEWMVDATIGAFLDPSDAILIIGFWRSGTTWLMESLASATGGKSVFEPLLSHIPGYKEHFHRKYGLNEKTWQGGLCRTARTTYRSFRG